MSMTRDRKMIVFECDECHTTMETETSDFEEAKAKLQFEGEWLSRRIANVWKNFCSEDCYSTFVRRKK